jgi:NADH-quinone oxidoreductase subunit C
MSERGEGENKNESKNANRNGNGNGNGNGNESLEAIEALKAELGKAILEVRQPREGRIFVKIEREALRKAVAVLMNRGFIHLTTITGIDLGNELELLYHLDRNGRLLSLSVKVPEEKPTIPTITDLIPGATLYEREVHDLLGIVFEGHPNLSRLVLPEDWPEGLYPLRKKYSVEDIRKALGGG